MGNARCVAATGRCELADADNRIVQQGSRTYLPHDFVATAEGLIFAVVDRSDRGEIIPCFLRYRERADGTFCKLGTQAANNLLRRAHPEYLFHCERRDADLHGVKPGKVIRHLRPKERLRALLAPHYSADSLEGRTIRLVRILAAWGVDATCTGVTGSILLGSQGPKSDIDLVLYDATEFDNAREAIRVLISRGTLSAMTDADYREAYLRRGCALTYEEFHWHEQRKRNKAVFEGTKLDLGLVADRVEEPHSFWRKLGRIRLSTTVTGDGQAFDYPARYQVENENIGEIVTFTATYVGQALAGERIEVRGLLEQAPDGRLRVIVGSDREATEQYLKVAL